MDVRNYLVQDSRVRGRWLPDLYLLKDFPRHNIPRYLFRAYSTSSRGTNSARYLASAHRTDARIYASEPPCSLEQLKPTKFVSTAARHLMCQKGDFRSPFISFSSTPLLPLLTAYWSRQESVGTTVIITLDTHKLDDGAGVKILPAKLLKQIINASKHEPLAQNYESEYLVYDQFWVPSAASCTATFSRPCRILLLTYIGELGHHKVGYWPEQLPTLLQKLSRPQYLTYESRKNVVEMARHLASQDTSNFLLPVLISLLVCRARHYDVDTILISAVTDLERDQDLSATAYRRFFSKGTPFNVRGFVVNNYAADVTTAVYSEENRRYNVLIACVCQKMMEDQDKSLRSTSGKSTNELICLELKFRLDRVQLSTQVLLQQFQTGPVALGLISSHFQMVLENFKTIYERYIAAPLTEIFGLIDGVLMHKSKMTDWHIELEGMHQLVTTGAGNMASPLPTSPKSMATPTSESGASDENVQLRLMASTPWGVGVGISTAEATSTQATPMEAPSRQITCEIRDAPPAVDAVKSKSTFNPPDMAGAFASLSSQPPKSKLSLAISAVAVPPPAPPVPFFGGPVTTYSDSRKRSRDDNNDDDAVEDMPVTKKVCRQDTPMVFQFGATSEYMCCPNDESSPTQNLEKKEEVEEEMKVAKEAPIEPLRHQAVEEENLELEEGDVEKGEVVEIEKIQEKDDDSDDGDCLRLFLKAGDEDDGISRPSDCIKEQSAGTSIQLEY